MCDLTSRWNCEAAVALAKDDMQARTARTKVMRCGRKRGCWTIDWEASALEYGIAMAAGRFG